MFGNMHRMGGRQMTPEEMFEEKLRLVDHIDRQLKMLAGMGRHGDTQLAHVTPEEQRLLEARGGSGTINPRTGLPEFFGGEGGGGSMGRDDGRVGGGGNRDDGRNAATVDSSRDITSGQSRGRGGIADPSIGRAAAERATAGRGDGISTNPNSAGGTAGPTGDAGAVDDRSFGERIADGIAAAFEGWGFGPPTKESPGLLGTVIETAVPGMGLPMGFTRFMQGMGVEGVEKEPGDIGTDEFAGQRDDGRLSPGRRAPQVPKAPPASSYAWTRPSSLPNAPMALGFDAGMTPLQMRSNIAGFGVGSDRGIFRDPATVDFYRNLAVHELTTPSGAPRTDVAPLPIEIQYLTQLGGQPGNAGSVTTESFLNALAGLNL